MQICLASFVLLPFMICSSSASQRISVAVVRVGDATPLRLSLKGFQEFFRENSLETDFGFHMLKAGRSNDDVVEQIRKQKPRIVLSLGSKPLRAVCSKLGSDFVVIGVSLCQADFECAGEVGGVYLEHPPEVQLEWIHRILPKAGNIGVIYSTEQNKKKIAHASRLAGQMGMTIFEREVSAPYQIPAALSDLADRADVLWGISDSIVLNPGTVRKMLLFSFRNKIPFVGLSKAWGKAGALYALDRDYTDIGRQCAEMAYGEIRGEKFPLSPRPPRLIKYYLNLKTARHLKIDISSSLVQGAEESY